MYLKPLLMDFHTRTGNANKDVKQKRMPVKSRYSFGILNWNCFNWRRKTCGAMAIVCHKARVGDCQNSTLFALVQYSAEVETKAEQSKRDFNAGFVRLSAG